MKKLTRDEFNNLPFGTNIIICDKGSKYNAVVIDDKIYYEDGRVDYKKSIADYIYNESIEVYSDNELINSALSRSIMVHKGDVVLFRIMLDEFHIIKDTLVFSKLADILKEEGVHSLIIPYNVNVINYSKDKKSDLVKLLENIIDEVKSNE